MWRRVEDMMPATGVQVLVAYRDEHGNHPRYAAAERARFLNGTEVWASDSGDLQNVTHWMPLPPLDVDTELSPFVDRGELCYLLAVCCATYSVADLEQYYRTAKPCQGISIAIEDLQQAKKAGR